MEESSDATARAVLLRSFDLRRLLARLGVDWEVFPTLSLELERRSLLCDDSTSRDADQVMIVADIARQGSEANVEIVGELDVLNLEAALPLVPLLDMQLELEIDSLDYCQLGLRRDGRTAKVHGAAR